jgi:16S rRNA (uracil1498-N3)-methyltransferase
VSTVTPTQVQVILLEEESDAVEAPLEVIALQAVSHDESFEHAVDQMTTLGVTAIVPLLVERSKMGTRRPDPKRLQRWQKIAREACKLSWRRLVPRIEAPALPSEVSPMVTAGTLPLLLDTESRAGSFREVLSGPRPDRVILAIGPEGGFSETERGDLLRAEFRPVSLGPRVLRTEHAGAAAMAIMMASWGDVG